MLKTRFFLAVVLTAAMTLFISSSVFAGSWAKTGNTWSYTKDDGTVIPYDPQTPLRGVLDDYFVINDFGRTCWKYDSAYLAYVHQITDYDGYITQKAVAEHNPEYFNEFGNGNDVAALAELSGISLVGSNSTWNPEPAKEVAQSIREFLIAFPDWQGASDYEKAVHIANWITRADYGYNEQNEDDSHFPYGCLVNKKAVCDGYTNAAYLLAQCIDLKMLSDGTINHVYPVFVVDGMLLAYEPTTKNNYFTMEETMYNPTAIIGGEPWYSVIGHYCMGIGYQVPETSKVKAAFPNVREIFAYGKYAPYIYFK